MDRARSIDMSGLRISCFRLAFGEIGGRKRLSPGRERKRTLAHSRAKGARALSANGCLQPSAGGLGRQFRGRVTGGRRRIVNLW